VQRQLTQNIVEAVLALRRCAGASIHFSKQVPALMIAADHAQTIDSNINVFELHHIVTVWLPMFAALQFVAQPPFQ